MPTQRFSILAWQNLDGTHYAAQITDAAVIAAGSSQREAVDQVSEHIQWRWKHHSPPDADFENAELLEFTIRVRPEYSVWRPQGQRVYSCEEEIVLRIACVKGNEKGGMLRASIPLLGIHFHYTESEKLRTLVEYYVRERLKGLTPAELSRCLPPRSYSLQSIVLREPKPAQDRATDDVPQELGQVAEPIGSKAFRSQLSRPWERETELAELIARVGSDKANVILVGEAGCGKTALLAEAVRKLELGDERKEQEENEERAAPGTHRFWMTQAARLIAGMRYLGQWQERCEDVIAQLSERNGVLCLDNLLELLNTGGDGPNDSIAAFFVPYLQRGELRLVAECTPSELDACRRLLPGFVELFQIIRLEPFSRAAAMRVLERHTTALSQHSRISMGRECIELCHRLFSRFRPYEAFPGKATQFLRDLFERAKRAKKSSIGLNDVLDLFTARTGLPELFLRDDLPLSSADALQYFESQVIGQDDPCRHASQLVATFKAGLNDPTRPLGVLLFCGPTGVGKTELARAIARYFFGHGDQADARMIRLDMSEYAGHDARERLLGGREQSQFLKQVRQQPFSVVLFDEIEKAAPEVFDLMLSLFDEGRLSDDTGRVVNFRSTIIILTSNIGADKFDAAGFHGERAPAYQVEAQSFFRPEFFNRLDAVVSFRPLDAEVIRKITVKELEAIAAREGLHSRGIRVRWTDKLVERIASVGVDRRYGARPLQRTLERMIIAPLSRWLIAHPKAGGGIRLDMSDDGSILIEPLL